MTSTATATARAILAARVATVDEIITMVTGAPTGDAARAIMARVPALMVCTLADQLFIDADFRGIAFMRGAVVDAARA